MREYHHDRPCDRCGGAFVPDPDDPARRWVCGDCGAAPRIVLEPGMVDCQNSVDGFEAIGWLTADEAAELRGGAELWRAAQKR